MALIIVQSSNPGLPGFSVLDHVPEYDELPMASLGCRFWSLDNIAPLRQLDATTTGRDRVLFATASAYRSANGVVFSWVGEGGARVADAELGVIDAGGEVLCTIEPAQ